MTEQTGNRPGSERRLPLPSAGLAGVIALAVALSAVAGSCWWPYYCEQRVVRQFETRQLNVDITREYIGPEFLRQWSDREWMAWMHRVQALRVDHSSTWRSSFSNVVRSTTSGTTLESLPNLASLRRCRSVEISGVLIEGPESLRGAATCERLARLRISNSQISSDALRGLDGLGDLQEIRLDYVSVPGDLLELPRAPSLRSFCSDRAMFRSLDVSGTPNLQRVEAKNCSFSDEGVAMLLEAPHLEVLMFPNGSLTDASVDDLLQLRELRYLDLRHNSRMTLSGLERLAELPRLQTVNVHGTGVATEQLQHVLPQAKSSYGP